MKPRTNCATEHFTIFEPRNPSLDDSELHRIRRSTDIMPLKLLNARSARPCTGTEDDSSNALSDRTYYTFYRLTNFKLFKNVNRRILRLWSCRMFGRVLAGGGRRKRCELVLCKSNSQKDRDGRKIFLIDGEKKIFKLPQPWIFFHLISAFVFRLPRRYLSFILFIQRLFVFT